MHGKNLSLCHKSWIYLCVKGSGYSDLINTYTIQGGQHEENNNRTVPVSFTTTLSIGSLKKRGAVFQDLVKLIF